MIDYSKYTEDENFMKLLRYFRANILVGIDELSDQTDFDRGFIEKHFNLIQAIVSEEIMEGKIKDEDGAELVKGFINMCSIGNKVN